jgi:hypothetical protein
MRRTHLRGRENILKRQLIHVCALNLSLIFRQILDAGTPRELNKQGREALAALIWLQIALLQLEMAQGNSLQRSNRGLTPRAGIESMEVVERNSIGIVDGLVTAIQSQIWTGSRGPKVQEALSNIRGRFH